MINGGEQRVMDRIMTWRDGRPAMMVVRVRPGELHGELAAIIPHECGGWTWADRVQCIQCGQTLPVETPPAS